MIPRAQIQQAIRQTLLEDIGSGDLTASLIDADLKVGAALISRQEAVLCGTAWFEEVFSQLDPEIHLDWQAADGDSITADQLVCRMHGRALPMLSGERTALNWLQTLSGTATVTRAFVERIAGTKATILDTRKTIPGLRRAQKYAVRCGGGDNHRMGLYDGVLIKENHLRSGDTIEGVLARSREKTPEGTLVEIEVDDLDQLKQALAAGATRVLLDNFDIPTMREAVSINKGRAILEASGGVDLENIRQVAKTGVHYISVGALTKNITAVDLSLEFEHR